MGQTVQKVRRSVERVHDPAACWVLALFAATFFGQPAIGGTRAHQFFFDGLFGLKISAADKVACTFHGYLKVLYFTEILDQPAACAPRGLDHDI